MLCSKSINIKNTQTKKIRFTGWGDLCQFLDPADEIFFHGIEPAQFF